MNMKRWLSATYARWSIALVVAALLAATLLVAGCTVATPKSIPTPTSLPPTPAPLLPTATPPAAVTNFRVSSNATGGALATFAASTSTVYLIFDYTGLLDDDIRLKIFDATGGVVFDQAKKYSGSGTEVVAANTTKGAFDSGSYLVNMYRGPFASPAQSLRFQVEAAPTATPPPSPLPTATPVPTSPRPPTPTSPRPTTPPPVTFASPTPPCQEAPVRGFGQVWFESQAARDYVGCPSYPREERGVDFTAQRFDKGVILYTSASGWFDKDAVVVLFQDDGTWLKFIVPGNAQPEPIKDTPPAGHFLPQGRIGYVWQQGAGVRSRLGWPIETEKSGKVANNTNGAWQAFERGYMYWIPYGQPDDRWIYVVATYYRWPPGGARNHWLVFKDTWNP